LKERQKGEDTMARRHVFAIAVVACILALVPAMSCPPAFAASNEKSSFKATVTVPQDGTLGGKMVKEGTYQLKTDGSMVTFIVDGKVVAEAPGEWKDSESKSSYDFLRVENGAIKEIHFGGKTRYLSIQS
jgi:hypothetical protein